MCASTNDAILIALPSAVESNWKSIAHNTFGASATTWGTEDVPDCFRGLWTRLCRPSRHHSRCTFFTLIAWPSSWRSAAQAHRNPWQGCLPAYVRNQARISASGSTGVRVSGLWADVGGGSARAQPLCRPTVLRCSTSR